VKLIGQVAFSTILEWSTCPNQPTCISRAYICYATSGFNLHWCPL